jgi:hypothetical protein
MLGFFRKKEQPAPPKEEKVPEKDFAPLNGGEQDGEKNASFEVPDFTEDDLNFDLGLGEFISEGKQSDLDVKSSQAENSQAKKTPAEGVLKPAPQPAQPSVQQAVQKTPAPARDGMIDIPGQGIAPASSPPVHGALAAQGEVPDDELPRFQVERAFSASDFAQERIQAPRSPSQVKEDRAEERRKAREAEKERRAVQTPQQGVFITKEDYSRTILLSDETVSKSSVGQSQLSGMLSASESQGAVLDELRSTLRAIGESLMFTDSRLFGQGDGR